ncbi:hypothetical protein [uncultured Sphingomonas sp.]|uniref:hypothetical protein n=1 Tax=uncultured Sphingomonas sp. TaxID=158754 RepID=UPI0025CFAB98|nr:hypothetical protein [uncultured Sphingomonas sp.]
MMGTIDAAEELGGFSRLLRRSTAIRRIVVAKARFIVRFINALWASPSLRSGFPTSPATSASALSTSGQQTRARNGRRPGRRSRRSGAASSADRAR